MNSHCIPVPDCWQISYWSHGYVSRRARLAALAGTPSHKQRTSVNSSEKARLDFQRGSGWEGGGLRRTWGRESEALQLIFPPWRPSWEEQQQAAFVFLLWDFLPVQTKWSRASGLMGTRPAEGPKLSPLVLSPSLSPFSLWPSWRMHFNDHKQTWKCHPLPHSPPFPTRDSFPGIPTRQPSMASASEGWPS